MITGKSQRETASARGSRLSSKHIPPRELLILMREEAIGVEAGNIRESEFESRDENAGICGICAGTTMAIG
jgi:hypothetical protein